MHIRMDGPGFDSMDVPGGASQPKLQFTIFVPTAEFFRGMRVNQASLDLVEKYGVKPVANGIERFITATRRQNFLVPPAATVPSRWSNSPSGNVIRRWSSGGRRSPGR
jgi:hypothetical protein